MVCFFPLFLQLQFYYSECNSGTAKYMWCKICVCEAYPELLCFHYFINFIFGCLLRLFL